MFVSGFVKRYHQEYAIVSSGYKLTESRTPLLWFSGFVQSTSLADIDFTGQPPCQILSNASTFDDIGRNLKNLLADAVSFRLMSVVQEQSQCECVFTVPARVLFHSRYR